LGNLEKVLRVLEEAEDWLTINQVAEKAGINRATASKHLHVLAAQGRAEKKEFTIAKLFRIKREG